MAAAYCCRGGVNTAALNHEIKYGLLREAEEQKPVIGTRPSISHRGGCFMACLLKERSMQLYDRVRSALSRV